MSLKFILKSSLVISLLAVSFSTYANTADKFRCPAIAKIRQAAPLLDVAVLQGKNRYDVFTSNSAVTASDLNWGLAVAEVRAYSRQEAIAKAKEQLKAVTIKQQRYAHESYDGYLYCLYGADGGIQASAKNREMN